VSHTSLMPQSVNVTFLLPPSWGQRTRFQNPTLLIQRPGHVFVQDHIRRPTTRCTSRPAMLAITAHPPAAALSWSWSCADILGGFDPACVDVECSGSVF